MARPSHTAQERQIICAKARNLTQQGVKFTFICAALDLKPTTLRAWLNNETRDWLYPQVPNQGRI